MTSFSDVKQFPSSSINKTSTRVDAEERQPSSSPSSWASYEYVKEKIKECEFTMAKLSTECDEDDIRYRRLEMQYAKLKLQLAEAQSEDDWKEFVATNTVDPAEETNTKDMLPEKIQRRLKERSEEHTSNSSHITISYAVFCLKKKKI